MRALSVHQTIQDVELRFSADAVEAMAARIAEILPEGPERSAAPEDSLAAEAAADAQTRLASAEAADNDDNDDEHNDNDDNDDAEEDGPAPEFVNEKDMVESSNDDDDDD